MAAERGNVEGGPASKPPFARRLRRRLIDAITILSLLLAMLAAWGWWRSHQGIYRTGVLERMTGDETVFSRRMGQVHSYNGSCNALDVEALNVHGRAVSNARHAGLRLARQRRTAQNWESEKIIVDLGAPGAFSVEVVRASSINRAPPLERV